jgi:hypothetical protein
MTHGTLLQQVRGPAYIESRQTLRSHIANLRRKIGPADGEHLIQTDHGVGCRFADTPGRCVTGKPASQGGLPHHSFQPGDLRKWVCSSTGKKQAASPSPVNRSSGASDRQRSGRTCEHLEA